MSETRPPSGADLPLDEVVFSVFSHADDPVLIARVEGGNAAVVAANDRAEELFIRSACALRGASLRGILGPHAWTEFDVLQRSDPGARSFVFSSVAVRPGNEAIPVRVCVIRLPGPDPAICWISIRDLTSERDSQVLFRAMLDALPVGIVAASAGRAGTPIEWYDRVIFCNRAALDFFGCADVRELSRFPFMDAFAAADQAAVRGLSDSFTFGGAAHADALQVNGLNGPARVAALTILRVTQNFEDLTLYVVRDRTDEVSFERERRDLQQQLLQSQKFEMVGVLAGGVAHDFNNFLSVIKSCTYFFGEKLAGDAEAQEDVESAEKAIARASELVRHLLSFVRCDAAQCAPPPLDAAAAIRQHIDMYQAAATRSVTITYADDGLPHMITIRPVELQQVLLNLVVNARDAMPRGGTIGITVGRGPDGESGRTVSITVSDTGEGIPSHVRDDIFKPLVTTKGPGKGTGLGLAMVQRIVTGYGGTIGFDTEVGKGTTFRIVLREAAVAGTEPPSREG